MLPVNAAALVAAGMLSVLIYPMLARLLLGRRPLPSAAAPFSPTDHRPELAPEQLQPPLLATTDTTDTRLPPPDPRTSQTPNGAIDQGPGGDLTKEPT